MRAMLAVGIAVVAVGTAGAIVLTKALAGPPPQQPFVFGTTYGRPIAGTRFTGLTVSYISNPLTRLDCHARIGDRPLVGRVQRFYEHGIPGPAAASCSWLIPQSAAGKTLRGWDRAYFDNPDGSGTFWSSGVAQWRVKP